MPASQPPLPPDLPPDLPPHVEALLRQQEALRKVVEEISSELELRPLLTRIVRHACELLEAHDGSIGLYDERRHVIRTEAVFRMPDGELGAEMGPGEGLAGEVLRRGEAVIFERYGDIGRPLHPELAEHAVIGLPIRWRGRLLGFFGLGTRPPARFAERHRETLGLFARHAAIAIENARRYEAEQQQERQRLARDLHDSVTQTLASATMIAESTLPALHRDRREAERRLERVIELNRSALVEMRALLRELKPLEPAASFSSGEFPMPALLRLRREGLLASLRGVLDEILRDGFAVELDDGGYRPQDVRVEEILLRVAQEAVHNARRHAGTSRAWLALALDEAAGQVQLTVRDEGVGFNARAVLARAASRPRADGGLGLPGMRERVQALAGNFRLESEPGFGTRLEVVLPLKPPREVRHAGQPMETLPVEPGPRES